MVKLRRLMEPGAQKKPAAWQPLTPRGVATFASASPLRLRLAQVAVAIIVVSAVLWFIAGAWFPVVQAAVREMPASGGITNGVLVWESAAPVKLAENRFLSISVDPIHEGLTRGPSHIQVEFGRQQVLVSSLLGYLAQPYQRQWQIGLNRPVAEPWWGAWSPILMAITAGSVLVVLFLSWTLLATLYAPIAWLVGFFANRDLSWRGAWRLSSAALLPGALLMVLWIFVYGAGVWDLLQLGIASAGHIILGWIYLIWSPLLLERSPSTKPTSHNPFKSTAGKK